jgi:hypothetical protein
MTKSKPRSIVTYLCRPPHGRQLPRFPATRPFRQASEGPARGTARAISGCETRQLRLESKKSLGVQEWKPSGRVKSPAEAASNNASGRSSFRRGTIPFEGARRSECCERAPVHAFRGHCCRSLASPVPTIRLNHAGRRTRWVMRTLGFACKFICTFEFYCSFSAPKISLYSKQPAMAITSSGDRFCRPSAGLALGPGSYDGDLDSRPYRAAGNSRGKRPGHSGLYPGCTA